MITFYKYLFAIFVIKLFSKSFIIRANYNCDSKLRDDRPSAKCINYERIMKSDENRQDIINKINSRRNKVASGNIRSLSAAENMLKLEWSDELAELAQQWADQCSSNPDSTDTCRDFQNLTVGQNIATLYGEAPHLKPSTLVDLWYMELLNINVAKILKYEPSSKTNLDHYDYFTQLIWSDSRLVGCGAVKFQENIEQNKNRAVYRLVCNFFPSGNIEGRHVYKEGIPCTGCKLNSHCDSIYSSLCETTIEENDKNKTQNNSYVKALEVNLSNETTLNLESKGFEIEDSDASFDIFSDLIEIDRNMTTPQADITRLCKDVLAIDELMDLLRKKLSTDNVLKEFLFSTKSALSDAQYSDAKVDAIVSRIYNKETTSTTPKPTPNDVINSTLLVDLVEAVIFRNKDKITSSDNPFSIPTEAAEGRTVIMQAELGAVKENLEFTGHYFFPEEEDSVENQSESTESYYDSSMPVSEIVLELEQLKRNKETKDFLDEILESDSYIEVSTQNHIATMGNDRMPHSTKEYENHLWKQTNDFNEEKNKNKREVQTVNAIQYQKKGFSGDNYMLITYNELLKFLAADLKDLKLKEKFHCAYNCAYTDYFTCSLIIFIFFIEIVLFQILIEV